MVELMSSNKKLEINKIYHGIVNEEGETYINQPFIIIKEINREEFIERKKETITEYGYIILEERNYFYEILVD